MEKFECGCNVIHEDLVENTKVHMPEDAILFKLADTFKVFGDPTRIKILYSLFENEMCVCDIAQVLGMSQSAISHQLKTLKQARLVKNRRNGKTIFYSLDDDHVKTMFNQGLEHVKHLL